MSTKYHLDYSETLEYNNWRNWKEKYYAKIPVFFLIILSKIKQITNAKCLYFYYYPQKYFTQNRTIKIETHYNVLLLNKKKFFSQEKKLEKVQGFFVSLCSTKFLYHCLLFSKENKIYLALIDLWRYNNILYQEIYQYNILITF